tara:strand:+ start:1245 stop:1478 length:234 start_codon:yes stop_codon:yes gene_type:complete
MMQSKRNVYLLMVFGIVGALVLSSKTTRSDNVATIGHVVPSKTQKALVEQRNIVDSLKREAKEIKDDADEVHREICP